MNNLFNQALADFYLGTPVRSASRVDELRSGDIFNIDNSSITDSNGMLRQIEIAVTSPEDTLEVGNNKAEIILPFDATLVGASCSLTTAPTDSTLVSLKNSSGSDMLIGYLQVLAGSTLSAPGTIDIINRNVRRNDPIRVTVNTAGTGATGLIVILYFIVTTFYTD